MVQICRLYPLASGSSVALHLKKVAYIFGPLALLGCLVKRQFAPLGFLVCLGLSP